MDRSQRHFFICTSPPSLFPLKISQNTPRYEKSSSASLASFVPLTAVAARRSREMSEVLVEHACLEVCRQRCRRPFDAFTCRARGRSSASGVWLTFNRRLWRRARHPHPVEFHAECPRKEASRPHTGSRRGCGFSKTRRDGVELYDLAAYSNPCRPMGQD